MSTNSHAPDSAFARRRRLYEFILHGQMGPEVVRELLPSGEPLQYERQLWDYKSELPMLPLDRKPTDNDKKTFDIKMAEIVRTKT